jgi:hypothetical protein
MFNKNMIESTIEEIGYDAEKLPLGQITDNEIKKGYKILD